MLRLLLSPAAQTYLLARLCGARSTTAGYARLYSRRQARRDIRALLHRARQGVVA